MILRSIFDQSKRLSRNYQTLDIYDGVAVMLVNSAEIEPKEV